ncbi:Glucomannan 4-beta-mannosyltransferase [Bertholletia excelsa]
MDRLSCTKLLSHVSTAMNDETAKQKRVFLESKRVWLIIPLLRIAVVLCLIMSVMLVAEKAYMAVVIASVKLLGRRPEKRFKWKPIEEDIPMFNEKEVFQLSISAACRLSWPSHRLIIQVLDDSTDYTIRGMVEEECKRWERKGINIKHECRDKRRGYKAGALARGMALTYAGDCDYVAIFDADFQCEADFLRRSLPFLIHNPHLALVQTRWKFVNADECLMTRMQEMSLDYHFTVEQEVGSSTFAFFGFNGTAGVWRKAAIEEAGGWKDRTTVEDMDLAIQASLQGWQFLYLGSVQVKNELPSTFDAYRHQQHRWSCGPANLFRKMVIEIVRNKVHVIYSFFFIRKIVSHVVTFVFYCIVLPATVLVPEVEVPRWGSIYVPCIVTLLNAVGTPRSLPLLIFWVLFENVMSLHRTIATFNGLLEAGRSNEWIVTKKLGEALKAKDAVEATKTQRNHFKFGERFHLLELGIGLYLLLCGYYSLTIGGMRYFVYIILQASAFFIMGFGCVGIWVPSS